MSRTVWVATVSGCIVAAHQHEVIVAPFGDTTELPVPEDWRGTARSFADAVNDAVQEGRQ